MEASYGQSSSPDWRSTTRGLLNKLKYILVHNVMADLTIQIVNNGIIEKEFNVHSLLFVLGSEVFERMLNSFKEGVSRVVKIKDVDPEIFEIIINYFYGQPMDLKNVKNLKQVQDLADIADYYMIHDLKDDIAKYYESLDSPQAACLGLIVADKFNAPKLKNIKLEYIISHTKEVVEQEEFLSLPTEVLTLILEQPILAIKEIDLFKAIEAWIKHNVDKYGKQIIDLLIPRVQYLSMTREEFNLGPAKSNLIKPEDLIALLGNLNLEDSMPFPSGFSQFKRNEFELNFKRQTFYKGTYSGLAIRSNKSLTVEGLRIFTLEGNPTETYQEAIVIKAGTGRNEDNWPIVGRFEGLIKHSSSVFVQLDEKLKISDSIYYIRVEHKPGERKVSESKPLNEPGTTLPVICIGYSSIYQPYISVMSIKLQPFEA